MTRFNKNADLYPALCGIEGLGTHLSKLHLNRAKLSNSLLAESHNPTVFPSGSVFTPYNNGECREHRLVDQRLTCDLQVRWFRSPRILSTTTATLNSPQTRIST